MIGAGAGISFPTMESGTRLAVAAFHDGRHQFESKDDPDWKTIADWIRRAH